MLVPVIVYWKWNKISKKKRRNKFHHPDIVLNGNPIRKNLLAKTFGFVPR